jgi:hypothetical protein
VTNDPNKPETVAVTPTEKRTMYLDHLAKGEAAIALGREHIAKQRAMVAQLQADGQDVSEAVDLLNTLLETQSMHEAHRETILSELKKLDAP